ncbi:MAG: hypothetical protein WC384_21280 [Prolixibacteraceae bacterium]|jgi:ABC-type uncharacterized transport system permease subunit
MKSLHAKSNKYVPGILILIAGILAFAMLFSPLRNVGIIIISIAALYLASAAYSSTTKSNKGQFRSKTRDRMLKESYKNK